MSLRDTRAANEMPSGEAVAGFAAGRAIAQAKRENGGSMRFPDHSSYIRYKQAVARIQLRQQFRAASAAAPAPSPTVPSTPTSLSYTTGIEQLFVSFSQISDGGSPIINYSYSINGRPSVLFNPPVASSPLTIPLGSTTSGTLTIKAINALGESISSDPLSFSLTSILRSFTTVGSDTWTIPVGVSSIKYLVVGGGGGGGGTWDVAGGGGGGGGMVTTSTLSVTGGSTVTITVGDGGIGGDASSNGINFPLLGNSRSAIDGSDGNASILSYGSTTITALGGGRGYYGGNNGSGGTTRSGGTGSTDSTPSTGGDGGTRPGGGGGGGGYTMNGTDGPGASTLSLTNGGVGRSGLFYSGTFGEGGKGGFGSNTTGPNNNILGNSHLPGIAGASNTGNGGNGGSAGVASWASGGKGGSGIVVLQYTLP